MQLTQEEIRNYWATGKEINGFTIHKMSYGDYFTEPKDWKGGENDGFSSKTKWFTKKIINKQVMYILE